MRNGPPPPSVSTQNVCEAVSSAFAAHPRPLTGQEVTTAITTALDSRPRPLTRRTVTTAIRTALDSRPRPLTRQAVTDALVRALEACPAPLSMEDIMAAVTAAFVPAAELATLRERLKWMELERERLQKEVIEAKAELADLKEKCPRGWKPYGIALEQSKKEKGQSGRSVSN